jgi:signal transduction histidine kinase
VEREAGKNKASPNGPENGEDMRVKSLARAGYRLVRAGSRSVGRLPRKKVAAPAFLALSVIGLVDYAAGDQISLAGAYAIPVLLAAWFADPETAFLLSIYSMGLWIVAQAPPGGYANWWIPAVNGVLRLLFYACLVVIVASLARLHRSLESLALKRALLLSRETSERRRLAHEVLEVAEREQLRIGQDLHDGLCQHLTGTALAGQVLAEKLEREGSKGASQARRIVDLVEGAIGLARGMAKGLHPVERRADGLMQALEQFAANISELFHVRCRFECRSPVLVESTEVATHLFRIAQEGVSNAIKHGCADIITITLEDTEQGLRLVIADNGSGIEAERGRGGLGLRIMADRMKAIGGQFSFGPLARGTELVCRIPQIAGQS